MPGVDWVIPCDLTITTSRIDVVRGRLPARPSSSSLRLGAACQHNDVATGQDAGRRDRQPLNRRPAGVGPAGALLLCNVIYFIQNVLSMPRRVPLHSDETMTCAQIANRSHAWTANDS